MYSKCTVLKFIGLVRNIRAFTHNILKCICKNFRDGSYGKKCENGFEGAVFMIFFKYTLGLGNILLFSFLLILCF